MPNWATNTIRFSGSAEAIARLASAISVQEDNGHFDFNSINPCPMELLATVSPVQVVKTQAEADSINHEWMKNNSFMLDEGEPRIRAITDDEATRRSEAYNALEWYSWCSDNWGTKWSGVRTAILDCTVNSLTVLFETAWDAPFGVFHTLINEWDISISGGTIHEDGNEFELHGSQEDFDKYFVVAETDWEEDGYTWTSREILLAVPDYLTIEAAPK